MKTKNFTKDWWFSFIEKNLSFSETQVYKKAISEDTLDALNNGAREMLRSRINRLDHTAPVCLAKNLE